MRDALFVFPDGRNQVCGWVHLNVFFSFHSSGELELCQLLVNPILGLSWRTFPICTRYLQQCQNKLRAQKSSILHMGTLHISKGTPRSAPETRFSDCSGMAFVKEFQTITSVGCEMPSRYVPFKVFSERKENVLWQAVGKSHMIIIHSKEGRCMIETS